MTPSRAYQFLYFDAKEQNLMENVKALNLGRKLWTSFHAATFCRLLPPGAS
jgi:hypothetical protein